ncbi:MAG: ureidoglycolate lyase [Spirochaetales bacterium]|nr:ureidoglycolate lyase [Spirochaetales bacterium]
MKEIKIEELSLEAFNEFGSFNNMINPSNIHFGTDPVTFYRDMLQQDMGVKTVTSFSICRVIPRDFTITISEYHSHCGEGILPLDNDIVIHVAPGAPNGELPVDQFKAFRVPKGTMVVLKPGVFHHAPWCLNNKEANSLIVLPQRTYANDCIVIEHKEDEKIRMIV